MEDRETPRMRQYDESKTTQIMIANVPHNTSGSGLTSRKFQTDGFFPTECTGCRWSHKTHDSCATLYIL